MVSAGALLERPEEVSQSMIDCGKGGVGVIQRLGCRKEERKERM